MSCFVPPEPRFRFTEWEAAERSSREPVRVKELRDKVAVITGAASGIGRAFARGCAARRMNVVLADIEREALAVTAAELRAGGARVLAVLTDVSKPEDVERLADRTLARFGAVHLLFNNAGVGLVGPRVWETTSADWEWVAGVNLSGVSHSLRVFVPIMLGQATECHVVNTASAAGLVAPPGFGAYNACKAAVVALSETLHHELSLEGARVGVSVLCPGLVRSRMPDSDRNRPAALRNDAEEEARRRVQYAVDLRKLYEATEKAMSPEVLVDRTFDAIREKKFYIFTHDWVRSAMEKRVRNMLEDRNPWIETERGEEGG
jgi:NAD(P)-dependent dehydrogenase (short-subunit alcohol dehydrogenase family)